MNYWTFNEDRILMKENDLDKLKQLISYRQPGAVTARRNRLRRLKYTTEQLDYQENFIKEGYGRLTNRIMGEHLKLKEPIVMKRIKVIDDKYKKQGKLTLSKELKKAIKYDSDKTIMEDFGLKDYELAVRKLILIDEERQDNRKSKATKTLRKKYNVEQHDKELKKKLQNKLPPECIRLKDLQAKRYKKRCKYLVEYKKDDRRLQDKIDFEGKLIQETDRNIVLENNKGRIESFMKVDFLIGEGRIKEV